MTMPRHRHGCNTRIEHWIIASAIVLTALTVGQGQAGAEMSRAEARRQAQRLGALGRSLFFDPSLSGSGKLACSSCHDPAHGFGPANDLSVQVGGSDMQRPGTRAVPSLKYLQAVPPF